MTQSVRTQSTRYETAMSQNSDQTESFLTQAQRAEYFADRQRAESFTKAHREILKDSAGVDGPFDAGASGETPDERKNETNLK